MGCIHSLLAGIVHDNIVVLQVLARAVLVGSLLSPLQSLRRQSNMGQHYGKQCILPNSPSGGSFVLPPHGSRRLLNRLPVVTLLTVGVLDYWDAVLDARIHIMRQLNLRLLLIRRPSAKRASSRAIYEGTLLLPLKTCLRRCNRA